MPDKFTVTIGEEGVTAIAYRTAKKSSSSSLILGHGAGTGQTSGFMVSFAEALAERGVNIVTFNFLYAEQGRSVPDRTDKLEQCYRAVIDAVRADRTLSKNGVAVGGKSMGGRIASQVVASGVSDIAGLVFLGYPLHPPGKPEQLRSKHLQLIKTPMLFVQGSRDSFGTPAELRDVLKKPGASASKALPSNVTIHEVEDGDHSFKVPKSTAPQAEVYARIQDEIARWLKGLKKI